MKSRILNLCAAFALFCGGATAQTLSVQPINVEAEADTEIAVNLAGATSMTALQFNLALPEGFTYQQNSGNYGITLGAAAAGHTLSVNPLASGELLVVLYNMNLNTFADGALLTIPVVASAEAGTTNGALTKVRTASATAVSTECADVNYSATVQTAAYELSVSAVGLATMYLNKNAVIPNDVEVYVASDVKDGSVQLEQVTGVLPANTGVVVRADQGSYSFAYTNDSATPVAENLFKGSVVATYVTPQAGCSAYVLSVVDGQVGMYLAALNGEGKFLNNANKAYMEFADNKLDLKDENLDTSTPGAQLSLRFKFPETTGIDGVVGTTPATLSNTYYDLQGRKVTHPTRGLYILNGKKVMVK